MNYFKKITLAVFAVSLISFNASAQWLTSGSNIYFNTGNVGIGTTSPTNLLHTEGGDILFKDVSNLLLRLESSAQEDTWLLYKTQGTDRWSIGVREFNNSLRFTPGYYTGIPSMVINTNGNVGIGTTNPIKKLEVANGSILVSDSTCGLILKSPDGTKWLIKVDNSGNLSTSISTKSKMIENNEDEIYIYPNPSQKSIIIENDSKNAYELYSAIFDMQGKNVQEQKLSQGKTTIDISGFPEGMYIVKIINEEGEVVKTNKIVKE